MATLTGVSLELSANRAALWVEFVLIFVAVPLLIYTHVLPTWPIPVLLVGATWALVFLFRDPGFRLGRLFRWNGAGSVLWPVLARDAFLLAVLGVAVWHFAPESLFSFVKKAPRVWALVMIFYPLFSVYPQELLFRAYFFRRYQGLFGTGAGLIAAAALAFSFVHIIFGNWISVALTLIGGVLFGMTYRQSGSLLLTSIEHAVFGNFLFTIGLGEYFYHVRRF